MIKYYCDWDKREFKEWEGTKVGSEYICPKCAKKVKRLAKKIKKEKKIYG